MVLFPCIVSCVQRATIVKLEIHGLKDDPRCNFRPLLWFEAFSNEQGPWVN